MTLLPVFKDGKPLLRGSMSLTPSFSEDPCVCCEGGVTGCCCSASLPETIMVTVSGLANTLGSCCAELNGTWACDYVGSCRWVFEDTINGCVLHIEAFTSGTPPNDCTLELFAEYGTGTNVAGITTGTGSTTDLSDNCTGTSTGGNCYVQGFVPPCDCNAPATITATV